MRLFKFLPLSTQDAYSYIGDYVNSEKTLFLIIGLHRTRNQKNMGGNRFKEITPCGDNEFTLDSLRMIYKKCEEEIDIRGTFKKLIRFMSSKEFSEIRDNYLRDCYKQKMTFTDGEYHYHIIVDGSDARKTSRSSVSVNGVNINLFPNKIISIEDYYSPDIAYERV